MPGRPERKASASQQPPTLQDIMDRLDAMASRIKKIEEATTSIEQSMRFHPEEATELRQQLYEIRSALPKMKAQGDEQETALVNKTLEVKGLPYHEGEDPVQIATKIGSPITPANIDLAYKSKSKPLVVRFLQTHVRDKAMKAYKKKNHC